jgi:hypothetical protein
VVKTIPLIFIVVLMACTELVTDKFQQYEKQPTVNAICIAGQTLKVYLSWAAGLDSLPLEPINNATIEMYAEDEYIESLTFDSQGLYFSNSVIEPEKKYIWHIIIPNTDTIVCSQTLPNPSPIINIEHMNIAGRNDEGTIYQGFNLTIKTDLSLPQYYEVVSSDGNFMNYTDPIILSEGMPMALFCNQNFDDSIQTITLNFWQNRINTNGSSRIIYPYAVTLRTVSYDYYCYQKQAYKYKMGKFGDINKSPFAIPFYSNIDNALGIIAGYSTCVSDTITPLPYVEN